MQSVNPIIGYLASGGAFLLLATYVALQNDRSRTQSKILIAAILTTAWGLGHGLVIWLGLPVIVLDLLEIAHITGWLFVLSGFFAGQRQDGWRWHRLILFGLPLIGFGTIAGFSILAAYGIETTVSDYLALLWMLMHVLFAIFGLVMIEAVFRNDDAAARWKIKHLCFGLVAVFGFDFYMFSDATLFQRVDETLAEARGYIVALSALLIAVSVSRSHIWQSPLRLSRNFAANSLTVMGCGAYLLLMAVAGYYIRIAGGSWGLILQAIFLVATVVLLAVIFSSRAFRARIRVFFAKNFFRYRFDYRKQWLNFAQALSRDVGQLSLNERIVHAIADIVDCTAAGLWVLSREDRTYLPTTAWNFAGPLSNERLPAEKMDSSLVAFLSSRGWVVDLEEWRTHPALYNDLVLPQWLEEHKKARLILPLIHRDELISFLILGAPRVPLLLNWELLDLLKTVSRQAAGYIAEQEAAAALSDARKMEEFNKRSAFVVHDVKNLVGQLSLMVKNAESHGSRPEFQKDMLETVQNTIQGMNKLLLQFKQQTAPKDPEATELSYAQLFSDQARKWQGKTGQLNIVSAKNADRISVNADDIQSVLDHLLLNACEASGLAGVVDLTFEIGASEYLIEVRDNGAGMDQDFVQNQLFKPFQSGKPDGMGMGAYQVRELIRGMGGRLEVDSAPDHGTAMRIFLPRSQCDEAQDDRA